MRTAQVRGAPSVREARRAGRALWTKAFTARCARLVRTDAVFAAVRNAFGVVRAKMAHGAARTGK